MTDASRTITLDGVEYGVAQFSQDVQNAIGIYNTFNAELQQEQLKVIKTQAALQTIGGQIGQAVKKELEDKKAAQELSADAADTLPAATDAKGQDA